MKHVRKPLPAPLKLLLILLLLGLLVYLGLVGMVVWKAKHVPPAEGYEAIIVLGAQVKPDGEPNLQLRWRLEAALDAWLVHPCPIVTCGAQGADEPAPEAEVMRSWLIAQGVPPEQVLTDSGSFNTRHNLRNAAKALPVPGVTVLVVTSDYHLPRALAMAEDEGLRAVGRGSPILGGIHWVKNYGREALAWVKYWLEKYVGLGAVTGGLN